jgi:hypothetical protein
MVNLILNVDGEEKTYNIPSEWNEVTVGQAADLNDLSTFDGTEIEKIVKILTIFCPDIDTDDIFAMTPEQFNQIVEMIGFISNPVDGDLADSIVLDGEEYFLKKDFTKLSMGEIISIDVIMKQTGGDISKALSKMLCIFLRKKKENGELETFKNKFMEREELFRSAKITDVNNLMLFFTVGEPS